MSDVTSIATSGLLASEKRVSIAANNIANAGTPGFTPQDVDQTAQSDGSVSAKAVDRTPASITLTNPDGSTQEFPNVSLDQELVNTQVATYDYKANAVLLKTQRELNKTLLDIQA
jgi:flagellar hook-associated protein FlgK